MSSSQNSMERFSILYIVVETLFQLVILISFRNSKKYTVLYLHFIHTERNRWNIRLKSLKVMLQNVLSYVMIRSKFVTECSVMSRNVQSLLRKFLQNVQSLVRNVQSLLRNVQSLLRHVQSLVRNFQSYVTEFSKFVTEFSKFVTEFSKFVTECSNFVTECSKSVTECSKFVTECSKIVTECSKSVTECSKFVTECSKLWYVQSYLM